MSGFKDSPFQVKIYDWVRDGSGSAIVNAVAGSGKTTTIVKACKFIPKDKQCAFLAFNKAIAEELGRRVPKHVEARTLNSLGHRAWTSHAGRVVLDPKKTYNLCKKHLLGHEKRLTGEITRLVGLAKAFGVAPRETRRAGRERVYKGLMGNSYDDYLSLIEHFDIDVNLTDEGTLIDLAGFIVEKSADDYRLIDYDDQLWLPVICRIPLKRYDWLIVDEAQDLSPVQRQLLRMSLKPGGRLLAVGDPHQAIYGFRGAASDSMELLKSEFSCTELPLSISYRCPRLVVELAKTIVPYIEALDTAPDGLVEEIDSSQYLYRPGDMVICRNSAPLVALAYELLAKRLPVLMMGRDIGEGLVKLIDKLKAKGIDGQHGLVTKLEEWAAKEIKAAMDKDREARAQAIEDKRDSILAFLKGCKATTLPKLKEEIQALFAGGQNNRIVLSTIHRAKGLEADRVFVYRVDLMPSPWARLEWQAQQEQNLIYVAYTRAMAELYLVEEWQDDVRTGKSTGTEEESQATEPAGEKQEAQAAICAGASPVGGADTRRSS